MVDIFLYPIIERVILMKNSEWNDTYEKLNIEKSAPFVYEYCKRIRSIEKFKN